MENEKMIKELFSMIEGHHEMIKTMGEIQRLQSDRIQRLEQKLRDADLFRRVTATVTENALQRS